MKIYRENPSGNHDVPARQNAYNWTFSDKGIYFYPTWTYFQCVIMFKNQNERQEQYNQIICVPVTMIYKKWSPRDNIIFMLILHPKTHIPDYQPL